MSDPVTLTVGSIAALAFTQFLEASVGEVTTRLTSSVVDKMETLRQKIWAKLRGIPEIDELNATVEAAGKMSDQQIRLLTPHLEAAMKADAAFAQEIRQFASEINQAINIGEILGENVQNVYGGSAVQINDPTSPVLTGDISGGTFTFNITH